MNSTAQFVPDKANPRYRERSGNAWGIVERAILLSH